MKMHVNANGQSREHLKEQELHIATALQDVTGIDEHEIASAKRGEQIDRHVLKSVLDNRDFGSVIPAQHLIETIRVWFDKRNLGSGREEPLDRIQNYT